MMGVGKTSIGRNLAKKLNFTFVDIDNSFCFFNGFGNEFTNDSNNHIYKYRVR